MSRTWKIAAALAVAGVIAFRLAVVNSWHVPAGDGLQYYALSQELILHHRFAYAPPPAPLAWSRLPGYPLFLAAVERAPRSLAWHLLRATHWNVVLDLLTALLCAAIAFDLGRTRRVAAACFALVLTCPLLVFLSCYGLTESLATFLGALELWLALLSCRRRPLLFAALAGVVAGLSQLVRVDALSVTCAALTAFLVCKRPWRTTAAVVALFLGSALVTYAPWPIRNLVRFGAPHFEGTEWLAEDGQPLPNGIMKWMRSWASGKPGQCFDLVMVANKLPLDVHRVLRPDMYDSPAERDAVARLFARYNREHLSAAVDDELVRLASERAARDPLRHYLWLPLGRALALWKPVVSAEIPMYTRLLGLPAHRRWHDDFELLLYACALVGIPFAWRRSRLITLTLLAALAFRTGLHASAAHPCPTQRYLAVAFPSILILASIAIVDSTAWLRSRLRR